MAIAKGCDKDIFLSCALKVGEYGTNGIPLYIKMIKSEDYEKYMPMGYAGFWILGESATSSIPLLTKMLNNTNLTFYAGMSLMCLGDAGVNALLGQFSSANMSIKQRIVDAAASYGGSPPSVCSAKYDSVKNKRNEFLLGVLTNKNISDDILIMAMGALINNTNLHEEAVIGISNILTDPHSSDYVRTNALYVLLRIDGKSQRVMNVFQQYHGPGIEDEKKRLLNKYK